MVEGRDFFVEDLVKQFKGKTIAPVSMDAEAPLFLMYTSGSTGKPKGVQHRTAGYLAYVAGTSKYVQDIHPEDVYWCMADIGWITGHSYIVYGPLSIGGTTVIYEGVPLFPDGGRAVEDRREAGCQHIPHCTNDHQDAEEVSARRAGEVQLPLQAMTTVGEPIEPETWHWYYDVVGKGEAAITDTYWQTETGGFLCTTVPAVKPMKPGSAGPGALGSTRSCTMTTEEVKPGEGAAGQSLHQEPVARNNADHLEGPGQVRPLLL